MVECQLGNYDEALKRAQTELSVAKKRFGEKHPDVSASYNSIGFCLGKLESTMRHWKTS